MASLTTQEQTTPASSPAALEILKCEKKIAKWLLLIQQCKAQPLETSAGSKDYRAVLKVLIANANNLDMISCKFTVTIDACLQQLETNAWAAALCKSVEKACEGLVSSGTVAAACSCGQYLRDDLLGSLETVVLSLQKQIEMAEQRLSDSSNLTLKKKLAVQTGQVASNCKKITMLPKSNKGCLKRKILQAYKQTTDIISEQEEMITDSLESPRVDSGGGGGGGEGGGGGGGDGFAMEDDFFDDYDFTLSMEEIETSRSCVQVAKACEEFMKALAKVVGKHISNSVCSKEAIATIDTFIRLMIAFSNEINELGVCLCPPQSQDNVTRSMTILHQMSTEMSSCLDTLLEVAMDKGSNENERLVVIDKVVAALAELLNRTERRR
jgi:hypothetical protein